MSAKDCKCLFKERRRRSVFLIMRSKLFLAGCSARKKNAEEIKT
jgi:hypothetical protein